MTQPTKCHEPTWHNEVCVYDFMVTLSGIRTCLIPAAKMSLGFGRSGRKKQIAGGPEKVVSINPRQ